MMNEPSDRWDPEPRWHGLVAVLAVGGLFTALPSSLIIGPRWLFPAIIVLLLIPTVVSHRTNYHRLNQVLGFTVTGIITGALILAVIFLISVLPEHRETPTELLLSAASLWITNILVFALWYWRLDAGGPHGREKRAGHLDGAFLFPQMTLPSGSAAQETSREWSPNFIDYLFLAFNTSTAFSPTDVPVLARWGKVVMMIQSSISLTVLVLLAARAVNIL
ncbi:MAG: hypothetical protein ABJA02_00885 [Acidobacteriota bacterium]